MHVVPDATNCHQCMAGFNVKRVGQMPLTKRINKIFKFNAPAYKEMVSMHSTKDGILALVLSVVTLFFALFAALYLGGAIFNIVLTVTPFLIWVCSDDKIETLGFTCKNLGKSFMLGSCLGIPFFLFLPTNRFWPLNLPHQTIIRIFENFGEHAQYLTFSRVLFAILSHAVFLAFAEEIFCRGFVQTRIYGIIKSDFLAILFGGTVFALMHMPFRVVFAVYVHSDASIFASILLYLRNYFSLPMYLIWWPGMHFLLNYSYRKYNSIVAPLMMHFFVDLRSVFGL